jgi:hypothetical protein
VSLSEGQTLHAKCPGCGSAVPVIVAPCRDALVVDEQAIERAARVMHSVADLRMAGRLLRWHQLSEFQRQQFAIQAEHVVAALRNEQEKG